VTDDDPFEHVEITDEARAAIQGRALPDTPFWDTGRRLSNGNWSVPLQRSTIAAINQQMFPGESFSDAIVRMAHTRGRPLQ
jgi:hypothetical protein